MAEVGKPLDEWQRLAVYDALGLRPDGLWACFEFVELVPRQNGKGGITETLELSGLYLFHDQVIMHSAHLFKTAKMSFQRLVDIIDGSDWLSRRTKQIVRSRGDEAIILMPWAGGGQLLCFSRAGGSGRGFTGDKTVFDEAAYLTIAQYAAATPTLATVPNPQIIYTGTPPDDDTGPMPEDAMLPSVRARGHGGEGRIGIHEFSPPDDFDMTDRDLWYACNPALGIRIQEWFLEQQLTNFTAAGKPSKFATEHLGLWPTEGGPQWSVVTESQWTDAGDATTEALDPIALSVDVTPARTMACISAVGARSDGDLHGEIVDYRPGTDWVVARLVELVSTHRPCAVSLVGTAAAYTLHPELAAALKADGSLLEVKVMTNREVAAAFGMTVDALRAQGGRRLRWRTDRHGEALSAAAKGGIKRDIGEGSAWDRANSSVDISPLVALTNAVHTFTSTAKPPPVAVGSPNATQQSDLYSRGRSDLYSRGTSDMFARGANDLFRR